MDLREQQRGLLRLLKKRGTVTADDEYLLRVSRSDELGLAREIAVWWRALGIERNCPQTSLLLKRLGRFEPTVESFYCEHSTSPYMEEMARQFLLSLSSDSDPLLAALASFELACTRLAAGEDGEFVINWDRDPNQVFQALQSNGALPAPDGNHVVKLSRQSDARPNS